METILVGAASGLVGGFVLRWLWDLWDRRQRRFKLLGALAHDADGTLNAVKRATEALRPKVCDAERIVETIVAGSWPTFEEITALPAGWRMGTTPIATLEICERLRSTDAKYVSYYADALELFRKTEEQYRGDLEALMGMISASASPGVAAQEMAVRVKETLVDLIHRCEKLESHAEKMRIRGATAIETSHDRELWWEGRR